MTLNPDTNPRPNGPDREPVAVVGMACTFPNAPDLTAYWHNIVHKVDCISETPKDRWDPDRFYDPNVSDGSRIYAKRGGYLTSPFPFNAGEFGIMPKAVEGGEPDQFLVLKTAADAMRDAGIPTGEGHDRTEFILGRGSYLSAGAFNLVQRSFMVDQTLQLLSQLHKGLSADDLAQLRKNLLGPLKPFESETAPSVMPNITAGRVANRLGFMGPNYIIDAACASSLFAVDAAVNGLLAGKSDLALAGGVHIFNNIPFLSVFCALGAMSHQDRIRPFDKNADGLLPGEGVGLVVLKRQSDAERDGNRIYALIRSIGTSSDGRGISVAAPRMEGEMLAIERAYQHCDVSPETIGLIEAHGTATVVGDSTEIQALTGFYGRKKEGSARHCALGSVKSMIGHCMPAAGIAGLIKTTLSLYHKVLPATLNCDEPHPKYNLDQTPFYINTETRPWLKMAGNIPRRAGINAFGFGGVNAHVVMEEYEGPQEETIPAGLDWDASLFLLSGSSQKDLSDRCQTLISRFESDPETDLNALSLDLIRDFKAGGHRLSVIADSVPDLMKKLQYAVDKLANPKCKKIKDIKGIYYFAKPLGEEAKIAFMFPGEGSPYTNMMLDLCLHFPDIRAYFDELNSVIAARTAKSRFLPGQFIFPATLLTDDERHTLEAEFWNVDSGLQAILGASLAMNGLLARFGVTPDMIVGHSAGEYSSWLASGILDKADFYSKQELIASIYAAHRPPVDTAMVAVSSHLDKVRPLLDGIEGPIHISNDNCPHQVVVVGDITAMEQFTARVKENKMMVTDLPSKEVHHTPLAKDQAGSLKDGFATLSVSVPGIPVYSPVSAAPYPDDRDGILGLMVDYWLNTLKFRQTVERMYGDGARIFIEVGPGTNLSGFVDDTLRGKSFITIPANTHRKSGVTQFCHLLGILAAHHVPVSWDMYVQSRTVHAPEKPEESKRQKGAVINMELGLPELRFADESAAISQVSPAPEKKTQTLPEQARVKSEPTSPDPEPRMAEPVPDPQPVSPGMDQAPPKARIMDRYLANMEQFLTLQKDMMGALAGGSAKSPQPSAHPFVEHVIHMEPDKHCRVERPIRLNEDIFLFDHAFGGDVSDTDPDLSPLIVTPLTLNMEMMAEAASVLASGKILLELKNVKAGRWIVVDEDQGVDVEAEARVTPGGDISARLFDMSSKALAAAEGSMVFGTRYPPSEIQEPVTPEDLTEDAIQRAKDIYNQKFMTHGPGFQVIAGVSPAGDHGLAAHVRVPSGRNLFATPRSARLLLNPMLMDACAQLTGYWAQLSLKKGFITFPAGAQSIRFFGPQPGPGELLRVRMSIQEVNPAFVVSDLTMTSGNGKVWALIRGWTHRRFELPMELYHFYKFPRFHAVSRPPQGFDMSQGITCHAACYEALNQTLWQKSVGYLYLNAHERRLFKQQPAKKNAAGKWLAVRMAAKDAVRLHVHTTRKRNLLPADIPIRETGDGLFTARCPGPSESGENLLISVTMTDTFATARLVGQTETHRKENIKHG